MGHRHRIATGGRREAGVKHIAARYLNCGCMRAIVEPLDVGDSEAGPDDK